MPKEAAVPSSLFTYIYIQYIWHSYIASSDAGRWKSLEGPVVIGGDNLPSPIQIGFTDVQNTGGASGPPAPPVPAPLYYIRLGKHEVLG